ncbi:MULTISPECIES: NMCC_0638 family (lipo)protein [Silvimonas]|uniref:NMCC_0638 family (lipo)protein n=1 Tax=Silvimonas TaxID=300264 RepID=UPI0024B38EAA|nr:MULTISPECIES: hypothetical protein [Silvimonas]MDR3428946.1 hypothetical protein [Silvimonas sp.]
MKLKNPKSLFAICAALTACLAHADDSVTLGQKQANIATDIFVESCVAHPGNNKASADWAKQKGMQPANDKFTADVLRGRPGQVWGASSPEGQFILVLSEPMCSVWARQADAAGVEQNMQKIIKNIKRPGTKVKSLVDKTIMEGGLNYHQQATTIINTKEKAQQGLMMISTTTDSTMAPVQIRLTLSPFTPDAADKK